MVLPDACYKAGEVIAGRYRVEGVLGSGGMGVVYSAVHLKQGHRVALKVLLPSAATDRGAVARFLREARIAGQLTSEHVVRVIEVGVHDERAPFLVMEHLSGSNLADLLRERGPLPVVEAVGLILEACEGLAEAHSKGIVHRDIKPANLFLARQAGGAQALKVLDFGISKLLPSGLLEEHGGTLTATEAMMGSPRYMSPEQVRSAKHVDLRADIWSLGVSLYELTSGALPFWGDSSFELLVAIVSKSQRPLRELRPEVPPEFEQVVDRCLEKEPSARFAHAGELAEALAPFATSAGASVVPRVRVFADLPPAPAPSSRLSDPELADPLALLSPERSTTAGTAAVPAASAPASRSLVGAAAAAAALLALGAWASRGPGAPARLASPVAPSEAGSTSASVVPPALAAPHPALSMTGGPGAPAAASSAEPAASAIPSLAVSALAPRLQPRPVGGQVTRHSIRDESRK